MRWLKTLIYILLLISLIIGLVIASLVYFVDPNKLKPMIIEEVKNKTGYQLNIDGKMSWSFYPRAAIKIPHVTLMAPNKNLPFVDASDAYIATNFLDLWRARDKLQGNISIAHVHFMNVHAENVSANINLENNNLNLNPVTALFYSGKIEGTLTGSELATTPLWKINIKCSDIQVKPLLQDANGADSKIKINGAAQLNLQAEARGITREQILDSLNGATEFNIKNGVVEGIDINYFIKSAQALLSKDPVTVPGNSNQTAFDNLSGTGIITNGIVRTNDLIFSAPTFKTNVQGSVVLASSAIDLQLQVKPILDNSKRQWEIPIMISGDLKHPDIRLDMMEIQKLLAGLQVEKIKEEASKQIKKHVHGKAGEFLQKLLGK